jgi:hypothetical protein
MVEESEKWYEHHSRASKGFLDAGKVLRYIGINEGDRFLDLGVAMVIFLLLPRRLSGRMAWFML